MTSIKHLDNHNGMRCCDAFSAISKTVATAVSELLVEMEEADFSGSVLLVDDNETNRIVLQHQG